MHYYHTIALTPPFSKFTKNKLHKLTKQFCKESTNIKIVFSTYKLASLFSIKGKALYGLKSYVIYKFLCASCNTSYVAETCRHISAGTHEHLETDKSSDICRHLPKNLQCKSIYDKDCLNFRFGEN